MQIDRKFNHFISWDISFPVVSRVRQTRVWQIEAMIQLFFGDGGVGWVDYDILVPDRLN